MKFRRALKKVHDRQFTGLGALGGAVCGGILLYKGDESAFTTLMSVVARFEIKRMKQFPNFLRDQVH